MDKPKKKAAKPKSKEKIPPQSMPFDEVMTRLVRVPPLPKKKKLF